MTPARAWFAAMAVTLSASAPPLHIRDLQASRPDVPLKRTEAQLRSLLIAMNEEGPPLPDGAWSLRLRINTGGKVVDARLVPETLPGSSLAARARTWRLEGWPVPGDTHLVVAVTVSPAPSGSGRKDPAGRRPPGRPGA